MYREEFEHAVRECWRLRKEHGVQSDKQLDPLAKVVGDIFVAAGFPKEGIQPKRRLRLPGLFRPTKAWDVVVTYDPPGGGERVLAAAIEFKAQNGSIGKNMNNRIEEALGSAHDLRAAYEQGLFDPGDGQQESLFVVLGSGKEVNPWLGYFFLLAEDEESKRKPRSNKLLFQTDKEFHGLTYRDRYVLFCRRLRARGLYDAVCFVTSSSTDANSSIREEPGLGFDDFGEAVRKRARELLKDGP